MTEYIGSRERAKQFRKMLKDSFPCIKFSVRCDTGTAHNWITVKWMDGPAEDQVKDLLRPLHRDLTITRTFSGDVKHQAADLLAEHYPELRVFDDNGSIDWDTDTLDVDIIIGRKHIRSQTMYSTLNDIAQYYVLGDEKPFPVIAEEGQAEPKGPDSDDENLLQHENGQDARDAEEARGRLTRGNAFVLGMYPGERPHLDVRRATPFEAVLTTIQEPTDSPVEDLTPREITSLSPMGSPLPIFSVPALVMADIDGYRAGETVWMGQIISTVLDQTERVLVSRGDGCPLEPVTTRFLMLI